MAPGQTIGIATMDADLARCSARRQCFNVMVRRKCSLGTSQTARGCRPPIRRLRPAPQAAWGDWGALSLSSRKSHSANIGQAKTVRKLFRVAQFDQFLFAGSTGRRNTGVKSLCWGFKLQGLTWSFVELTSHFVQMGLRMHRQVGALSEYCLSRPLVHSFDPRCIGLCGSQK